jgi:predicted MFS family arabinose efflux permease
MAYLLLSVGVVAAVAAAYFASRIEDMPTKKAIAVVAGLYGAGMTALMFMRKDFRAAAPILAPVAAALMVCAFILYLMMRASGHEVTLTVRKNSLREQKIADAMKAVRKRKAAKRILKK